MKALIQRVQQASVKVEHQTVGEINQGIAILLGIRNSDTEKDIVNNLSFDIVFGDIIGIKGSSGAG